MKFGNNSDQLNMKTKAIIRNEMQVLQMQKNVLSVEI